MFTNTLSENQLSFLKRSIFFQLTFPIVFILGLVAIVANSEDVGAAYLVAFFSFIFMVFLFLYHLFNLIWHVKKINKNKLKLLPASLILFCLIIPFIYFVPEGQHDMQNIVIIPATMNYFLLSFLYDVVLSFKSRKANKLA